MVSNILIGTRIINPVTSNSTMKYYPGIGASLIDSSLTTSSKIYLSEYTKSTSNNESDKDTTTEIKASNDTTPTQNIEDVDLKDLEASNDEENKDIESPSENKKSPIHKILKLFKTHNKDIKTDTLLAQDTVAMSWKNILTIKDPSYMSNFNPAINHNVLLTDFDDNTFEYPIYASYSHESIAIFDP